MGRREDSKSAISALNRHIEVVDESCYVNMGRIDMIPENESAISALEKNRLVYYVDDYLGVQVNSKVRALLDFVTSRYRFRESVGTYSDSIERLDQAINGYKRTKFKADSSHSQYADEIHETIIYLIDILKDALNMYHLFVSDEFSTVSDLEERIRQTTRCKNECYKLRKTMEQLSPEKLDEWAANDEFLEKIISKIFKKHILSCLGDLAATNRKLVSMLDKLHKDKMVRRLNLLIDGFAAKYKRVPGYRPNISGVMTLPDCVSLIEKKEMGGFVDIDSAVDASLIREIAIDALKKSSQRKPAKQKEDLDGEIEDARGGTYKAEVDPLAEKIEMLFEAVADHSFRKDLSAMNAFAILGVTGTSPEDWLIMVSEYYDTQRKALSKLVDVEEKREIIPPFDGTMYVKDIIFRKKSRVDSKYH